jgi:hypothetical protein
MALFIGMTAMKLSGSHEKEWLFYLLIAVG